MNAEEMQRKIDDYEQKINDYERKMVRYERKIERLQDDIFLRDNEIRRAKFTVLQALPELNTSDIDPNVDILRTSGRLDKTIFEKACLEAFLKDASDYKDEEERKMRAEVEGNRMYAEWKEKINDGGWQLYITGPDQGENDLVEVEMPDLLEVKDKYGEELYNAIKIAWLEEQERRRTGVSLKPWNYEARREQTLTELLVPLQERIQFLKEQALE